MHPDHSDKKKLIIHKKKNIYYFKKENWNICFKYIFADPDFCCGMESPEMALNLTNISGPGHPNNRGPFWCCFCLNFFYFILLVTKLNAQNRYPLYCNIFLN